MSKLTKEQIMVGAGMVARGTSIRRVAGQLGVAEGTLRYQMRKARDSRPDGRARQRTALDGFEPVVDAILERLEDGRKEGTGRPVQARVVFEILQRDYRYHGSYHAVVRHLRRRFGVPPVRALRRVETPAGVQAQHDWFDAQVRFRGNERVTLRLLVGTLSYSRARFCWASFEANQLAWHTGHLALFRAYGGVPLWVRIDNLKTGVVRGAGSTGVLNRAYAVFARECRFEIDPCRVRTPSDKGKDERSVRICRDAFGALFHESWSSIESLQESLHERSHELMDRLQCPITGTSVREAFESERLVLQPLPAMSDPFDVVVARRVQRDCLVSFEGRRYSVPFTWVGRNVEILGTHAHVVIRADGREIARHVRHTRERLILEPAHYEGESTDHVIRPTPLGLRGRLQVAGLSGASQRTLLLLPQRVSRPLDTYVRMVEAAR
jgi:transposase